MTTPDKPKGILVESTRQLNEAKLSRLLGHFQDRGFAIVSARRGERSDKDNAAWHQRLKAAVRSAGYGFVPLQGRWTETNTETGEKETQVEPSLFIPDGRGEPDRLRLHAVDWCNLDPTNPQESVIFAWPGGPIEFILPNGSVDFTLERFRAGAVADIYSELRRRPSRKGPGRAKGTFVFEGWQLTPPPASFGEASRRQHDGELTPFFT